MIMSNPQSRLPTVMLTLTIVALVAELVLFFAAPSYWDAKDRAFFARYPNRTADFGLVRAGTAMLGVVAAIAVLHFGVVSVFVARKRGKIVAFAAILIGVITIVAAWRIWW
jgi:hypothetical protein